MPEDKMPPDDNIFSRMIGRDPIVAISPPQWVVCGAGVNIAVAAGNGGVYLAVQPSIGSTPSARSSQSGTMVVRLKVEEARQLSSLLTSALQPDQK